MKRLKTVDEVIDALGGTAAAARMSDRGMPAVSMWRASERIPSEFYLTHKARLEALGFAAPPRLWGMQEPQTTLKAAG